MIEKRVEQGGTTDRLQGRLLLLAGIILGLYAVALTLSPAVRIRSWQADFRWNHWLGMLVWLIVFRLAHLQSLKWLPERDPYLLPVTGLLSGWGVLTIWRLLPVFGLRQSIWLGITVGILIAGLRLDPELRFLRRFKYLWLTGSLALTALTLVLGTNPLGYGPRMWLGCCGVYLQPSEPLKLMLIAYLSAYLADRFPFSALVTAAPKESRLPKWVTWLAKRSPAPLLPLLAPTFVMMGLALVVLGIQRDLGTASIFFSLYAAIVYVASGRKSVLITAVVGTILAGVAGYALFDVVRVRVDAWLNPWLDPSGRSFQIVQSLLAIANGGLFGRGPGMGSPGLVPVVHSDLIFAAIAEEQGLVGSLVFLLLFGVLAVRGLRTALFALDAYRRYLAAGLTAYFVWQSLLIIGGSVRLFPLTGVTLPFVSYGGSSLLVSFVALLLLLLISARGENSPAIPPVPQPYQQLGAFLLAGLAACALVTGWWAVVRGPDLLTRTDNPRRAIDDRSVRRGTVLDRENSPIAASSGSPGEYERTISYPDLSNIVGYTNPTYGQAGLEASLDDYLRGTRGNSSMSIWWSHIQYGQPPPGLDVRLSLDLLLQRKADILLKDQRGALVLLDTRSGEILAMASHPTFNANQLDIQWDQLVEAPDSPLLNRAVLGRYPVGDWQQGDFAAAFSAVENQPAPQIRLPEPLGTTSLQGSQGFSPLQAALMAAAITADGSQPAPLFVLAVNIPQTGWVMLPALAQPGQVFPAQAAEQIRSKTAIEELNIWQGVWVVARLGRTGVTWYIGGTLPTWSGTSLALAVLLEQEDHALAEAIGQEMLREAMQP